MRSIAAGTMYPIIRTTPLFKVTRIEHLGSNFRVFRSHTWYDMSDRQQCRIAVATFHRARRPSFAWTWEQIIQVMHRTYELSTDSSKQSSYCNFVEARIDVDRMHTGIGPRASCKLQAARGTDTARHRARHLAWLCLRAKPPTEGHWFPGSVDLGTVPVEILGHPHRKRKTHLFF